MPFRIIHSHFICADRSEIGPYLGFVDRSEIGLYLCGLDPLTRPASLRARHPPRSTETSAPRSIRRMRSATCRLMPQFSSPQ